MPHREKKPCGKDYTKMTKTRENRTASLEKIEEKNTRDTLLPKHTQFDTTTWQLEHKQDHTTPEMTSISAPSHKIKIQAEIRGNTGMIEDAPQYHHTYVTAERQPRSPV